MRGLLLGGKLRIMAYRTAMVMCACLLAGAVANASYESDFEDLNASPSGTVLTGQDGYYIPSGTVSVDFLAYTYDGNMVGIPQNPEGGDQFIAGTGPAGGTYARAQRDMDFTGGTVWTLGYDFAATFLGVGPSAQNVGSFSIMAADNTVIGYIHLMTWVDPEVPHTFNAFFMGYDAGGTMFPQPGESPGPEWEGLDIIHWYRAWATIDLESNMIIEVGIIDLETMQGATHVPSDWYLFGGAAGGETPACFRFFAGGGVDGNVLSFDNITITTIPTATETTTWGAVKALYR